MPSSPRGSRRRSPVRNPLSLKKLVYLDGQKAVLYRSRMNPSLGRNFEAMDPLEWLARLADHIPDTGKHRTHFYGPTAYEPEIARGGRRSHGRGQGSQEALLHSELGPPHREGVPGADPLVRRQCGGPLKIIA
jgi:hypothetical protein